MSSSSLRVMECKVSLRDNWWVVSLVMASSKQLEFTFERVDFTMEAAQREHQNVKTQRIEVGL